MNIHEQLDKFFSLSPRIKVAVILCIILIPVLTLALAFWLGTRWGGEWSDSKYLLEREQHLQKAAAFETEANRRLENERQLSAENAFLRKTNEMTAEILRANDTKLSGDSVKFTELIEARNNQIREIDADTNFDSQLCGLCADAERSGFKLSEKFCARCKTKENK